MKIPWDNPWFLQFAGVIVLSLIGIYLPKESPVGVLIRRFVADWLGKNTQPRSGCDQCDHCAAKSEAEAKKSEP